MGFSVSLGKEGGRGGGFKRSEGKKVCEGCACHFLLLSLSVIRGMLSISASLLRWSEMGREKQRCWKERKKKKRKVLLIGCLLNWRPDGATRDFAIMFFSLLDWTWILAFAQGGNIDRGGGANRELNFVSP